MDGVVGILGCFSSPICFISCEKAAHMSSLLGFPGDLSVTTESPVSMSNGHFKVSWEPPTFYEDVLGYSHDTYGKPMIILWYLVTS